MVLPFLALGALALGGVASAIGAKKQAEATNRGIEKAASTPLKVSHSESQTNTIDMKQMVADAEVAGFNPLSVLRAGGLGGYGQSTFAYDTVTTGHNAQLYANQQSPGGAFLGGIGNMLGNVGSAGLQHFQHMSSLNTSIRVAEIGAMASLGRGGFGGRGTGSAYGGTGYAAGPLGLNSRERWTEEVPSVTNPFGFDWWQSHPGWADVETGAEARYGDVGGAVVFPFTFGSDVGYTAAQNVERLTGFNPRSLGPHVRETLGGLWQELIKPRRIFGNSGGNAPPLSLTVGGPNQTGL